MRIAVTLTLAAARGAPQIMTGSIGPAQNLENTSDIVPGMSRDAVIAAIGRQPSGFALGPEKIACLTFDIGEMSSPRWRLVILQDDKVIRSETLPPQLSANGLAVPVPPRPPVCAA